MGLWNVTLTGENSSYAGVTHVPHDNLILDKAHHETAISTRYCYPQQWAKIKAYGKFASSSIGMFMDDHYPLI